MSKDKKETNTNNNSNNDSSNINFEDISKEDLFSLELLRQQILASIISIYGSIVSYNAALQGVQVIIENYTKMERVSPIAPDLSGLQAAYIFLATRLIFTKVSFTRYAIVREKKEKGEFKYSLNANLNINAANLIGLLSNLYLIRGAEQIVARDNNQPIFGI